MKSDTRYGLSVLRRRCGFTVVELSVVLSTTLILMALLVPAVQAARVSQLRQHCRNNLKRIGLALHNYHDVFRTFPPGWVTAYQDADSHSGYGWQVFLLPYVDQAPLYNKLDFSAVLPKPDEADRMLQIPLEVFQCPSDEKMKINEYRGGYGRSCYSGNYGSVSPPRWADGRAEHYWPGAVPAVHAARTRRSRQRSQPKQNAPASLLTMDGFFSWNSARRMSDVTDGISNTIIVGERSKVSGWGIWAGVGANRFETDAVTDASHRSAINRSLTGYSSSHEGGVYFCLCDGSVKFVLEGIESKADGTGVFQAIASINGGEVFSSEDIIRSGPSELW